MACGDAAEGEESSRRVVDAFAAARATFGIVDARRGAGGREREVCMSSAFSHEKIISMTSALLVAQNEFYGFTLYSV